MAVIDDIKLTKQHLPKKIMYELYGIEANPRYATLRLFLQHNYPQYNNDEDAAFIWDHSHDTEARLLQYLK